MFGLSVGEAEHHRKGSPRGAVGEKCGEWFSGAKSAAGLRGSTGEREEVRSGEAREVPPFSRSGRGSTGGSPISRRMLAFQRTESKGVAFGSGLGVSKWSTVQQESTWSLAGAAKEGKAVRLDSLKGKKTGSTPQAGYFFGRAEASRRRHRNYPVRFSRSSCVVRSCLQIFHSR